MPKEKIERQILKILKLPSDNDDLDFIKETIIRYPGLDYIDEAKKMMAWLRDNVRIKNKKPRLRFRNWCRIAYERTSGPARFENPYLNKESNEHYIETQKVLSEIRKKLIEKFRMNK